MTDKAYIVANEQQEREVLEQLEREGLKWKGSSEEPTQWTPTHDFSYGTSFPYILFGDDVVSWCSMIELDDDYEIVYDGRKESKMKISKEVYDALNGWLQGRDLDTEPISGWDMFQLPKKVDDWIMDVMTTPENNNRLITIIRWVNGEDVFEVEKPKKWVVRSKVKNQFGDFGYVSISEFNIGHNSFYIGTATRFDTKEEAQEWANSHQEVVEVVDV